MPRILLICIITAFSCCKTPQAQTATSTRPATQDAAGVAYPMSCSIKGRIVSILQNTGKHKDSTCIKYPCEASVALLEVMGCGPSVPVQMQEGDILTIRFAYTLFPTDKLFPGMRRHYPGLNSGDVFTANVEQRPAMGKQANFVVYDYQKQ